jgi:hypothetical protein
MTQNIVFKDDLEELKNIIDEIIAEEDPPLFNEEDDYLNFIETALIMMEQYIDENHTIITDPDFNEIFANMMAEFYYTMWTKKNTWQGSLKNKK